MRTPLMVLVLGSILWMGAVITQFHLDTSTSSHIPPASPRPGASPRRRGARATPPRPPPPPDARFTSHWCHSRDWLPDNAHRASCLFHNLCVVKRPPDSPHGNKRHEVEFLYVLDDEADARKKRVEEGDASFTLGIGPHSGDERVVFSPVPISMRDFRARYPAPRYLPGTSVLYHEYNSENFGHFLTDVLLPIYVALEGFGLERRDDLTLFRYSIADAIGWSCDFHRRELAPTGGVSPRYGDVGKHCDRFYAMTPQLVRGHRPLQVLNGTTVAPTCFQDLVVGMPMYSDDCIEGNHGREQNIWSLCNHARQGSFWRFRNYLLENALGDDVDVEHQPTHHKITITYRKDRIRGLRNLDPLIDKIKDKYDSGDNESNNNRVEVIVVEWETLSIQDQLELIRTTTVHITPPGGVSHIALFLPRWATSIRLYSMEYRMEWHIFHYLGYISVEHVDCSGRIGNQIPLDQTMGLVDQGLRRYDEYRVGSGDTTWTPFASAGDDGGGMDDVNERGISPRAGRRTLESQSEGAKTALAGPLSPEPPGLPPPDPAPWSEETRPRPAESSLIPRTVYQSWISRDMAPLMRANLATWRATNGDYEFVFFDDAEQRAWMERNCTDYWPTWRDLALPAARADLFRYCLLFQRGGIWSDVDVAPVRPLRDFLSPATRLVVVHDGGMPGEGFLYSAFLAAAPGHPALGRALEIVREHHRDRLKAPAVFCTGPRVLWRAVNDTLAGRVQSKSFVGTDEEHGIEYLSFNGEGIISVHQGRILKAKYNGYLKDATMHGGEPHYGREVTWNLES